MKSRAHQGLADPRQMIGGGAWLAASGKACPGACSKRKRRRGRQGSLHARISNMLDRRSCCCGGRRDEVGKVGKVQQYLVRYGTALWYLPELPTLLRYWGGVNYSVLSYGNTQYSTLYGVGNGWQAWSRWARIVEMWRCMTMLSLL